MRGPVWPRNRPTSLVGGGGQDGMGGEETQGPKATPAQADGGGGNSGRPDREAGPRLRATGHSGAPPSRRGAPYSLRAGPAALPDSRRPGTHRPPGPRRGNKARTRACEPAPQAREHLSLPQPRRLSAAARSPPPRRRRPPARPRAYLVLDFGGEPVGRALVEVGHGCSDDGKGLRSDSGGQSPSVSLLLVPATAARVMHELAPLRGAGEAGTQQTDEDDAPRFARTRVPRRLRVALEWDRLPSSLPAPPLRTLCPQPGSPPPSGLQGLAGEPDQ